MGKMDQVKQLLDTNPWQFDGMNFTQFKNHCKSLGIRVKNSAEVVALFTPTEYEGLYHYRSNPDSHILVELSDPRQHEPNRVRKAPQYYFSVMGI
jgi:hypothetical protein